MSQSHAERFRTTVAAILGIRPEDVTDQMSPDTVDTWDSLNQINLLGALEQEFGVALVVQNPSEHQSIARLKSLLGEHGVTI